MRIAIFICLTLIASSTVFGQSTAAAQAFELTEVDVSPPSDNPSPRIFRRDGRYELLGATMLDLVSLAYDTKPDVVTGGPAWLESDRFDVVAKTADGTTSEMLKAMLKTLLSDRFKLVTHKDTGLRAAYLLTTGQHPRMKQADSAVGGGCDDQPSEHSPTMNAAFGCHNMTMAAFADLLRTSSLGPVSGYVSGAAVVDQTGLKGAWSFNLKWTGRGLLARAGSDAVTLFDAVDEQLGLKLEQGNALLPVLVVDSVNQTPGNNLPGVAEKLPALKLEFEVSEIKPSTQDKPTAPKFTPGGGMTVKGVTLIALIQHAWGLDSYDNELIVGGPK